MADQYAAIIERDGECYVAYCPEVSGADGQGRTKEETRWSLAEDISLIVEDRREEALRGVPPDAECDTVIVE